MPAQTTTTPVQANEATPIGARKAKRAALTAILPGETPVQAAIRAAEHHRWQVMEAASKAHTAAEEAESDARAALNAVPFPADLIVQARPKVTDDPLTWVTALVSRHPVDGREIRQEIGSDRTERLDSRDAIIAHFGADHSDLQKHIAAFESWEAETAPLRHAAELAKKAEDKTERAFRRSYTINDCLCRAILHAPAEPGETLQQVEAYARLLSSCNGRNIKPEEITFVEDQAPLVKFMLRALKSPTNPPPSPVAVDPAIDFELLSAVGDQMQLRRQQEAAIKAEDVELAEQHTEAMQPVLDRAIGLRAKTLAGLMGRVWLIEDWAPTPDSIEADDLEWKMVHSLLDDIKALYAAHAPQVLIGSKAVTAGWIAAGAAQRCGVPSLSTDPIAIAAE